MAFRLNRQFYSPLFFLYKNVGGATSLVNNKLRWDVLLITIYYTHSLMACKILITNLVS